MPKQNSPPGNTSKKRSETFGYAIGHSDVGPVVACVSEFGIAAISMRHDESDLIEALRERFPDVRLEPGAWEAEAVLAKVLHLIAHTGMQLDLPLNMHGTVFQRKVWRAVQQIPAGKTSTYSEIARAIGRPRAVRAVGSACTNNPFAFVVPCHRVLHTAPSLSAALARSSKRHQALVAREMAGKP